ncbi:MAG TPA: hypothetical protein VGN53_05780 [Klebsiella sp.]|jgi:hypothetical protein
MTNNKLTATVEHLIDAVGHWQQDYDPKEDSEQYDFFGQLSAALRELQERRKAEKDSEPVAWRYRTTDIKGNANPHWSFSEEASELGLYQPLYAHPPITQQEPVAWIVHARTGDQLTTDSGYVANAEGILGLHSTPLYRHAQQTVVPDERAAFNAWNNEDNLPIDGVGAKNAAWLAWQARAKLTGNSPVIPEGFVMVPKEPTKEMILSAMRDNETGEVAEIYELMIAAAPQEVNHG